jgi:hypothetical protein
VIAFLTDFKKPGYENYCFFDPYSHHCFFIFPGLQFQQTRYFYRELSTGNCRYEGMVSYKNVMVSFADDNVRYPKEKVPGLNKKSWITTAWKGEKVHTQLLVWTKTGIPDLSIMAGDLTDDKGNRITSENIKTGFVRYVMTDEFGRGCDTRKTSDYDSSLVEDPIDIVNSLTVNANTVQPVWISIRCLPDIPPAIKGKLTLSASGKFTMNIFVNVTDHLLPPPGQWKYDLDLWQSRGNSKRP